MKLIITSKELETEFKRLTKGYKKIYFITAWAGVGSNHFNDLLANENKINRMVVGIHFYQTHPDFIETYINNKNVKFVVQPQGTFHPKLYLFYTSENNWEMIVGSSNFTKEAFNKNTEANTLITNKDINSESILATAFKLINESWKKSKYFDDKELIRYRTIWKNHRPKIKSLSGFYGSDNGDSKPIHEVAVTTMTWDEFVKKVRNDRTHGLKKRLRVISIAQDLFSSKEHFNELEDEERKFIAGIPNKCKIRGAEEWGFFGSMKGSGVFKNKIIFNDSNISNALDKIPLKGQITKTHYDNFINTFKKAFIGTSLENTKCIAIASRLLAMKRPDIFVCLASKNKSKLCKDFGIPQSNMSFERYWEDIILRIFDSDWWRNPETKDEQEVEISKSRVAFLDALYYVPSIN